MRKYYVTSVLVSFLTGFVIWSVVESHGHHQWEISDLFINVLSLPGGFLAGFVGHWIERKRATSLNYKKILLIPVTISLSFGFSVISVLCFWTFLDWLMFLTIFPS